MESNIIQAWLSFLDWYLKFATIPFRLDPMTMERDDTPPDFVTFRESFIILRFAPSSGNLLEPGPKEVRNPNIATAFRRIGFSENPGWGLNDVIANWPKLGHARPVIINDKAGQVFEVTLWVSDSSLVDTEQIAVQVED